MSTNLEAIILMLNADVNIKLEKMLQNITNKRKMHKILENI